MLSVKLAKLLLFMLFVNVMYCLSSGSVGWFLFNMLLIFVLCCFVDEN